MTRKAKATDLLLVSKSPKAKLDHLLAGAQLERRTGYTVVQLVARATRDRLRLAAVLLKAASDAVDSSHASFRSGVSRSYYSMYHAFRAVSFFVNAGDDYEEHSRLPGGIPADFPDHEHWTNDLKIARLERNRADYDPYPNGDEHFEGTARALLAQAGRLLPLARAYLRKKGCAI